MIDLKEFSQYIKIIEVDPIEIQVANTEWHGAFDAYFLFETYQLMPSESIDEDIHKVVDELLKDRKYFRKCEICSQINHVGNMDTDIPIEGKVHTNVCHGCMEKKGNIIF